QPHNRVNRAPTSFASGLTTHQAAAGSPLLQQLWLVEQAGQVGIRLIAPFPQTGHQLLGVAIAIGLEGEVLELVPRVLEGVGGRWPGR
ncbi:MAG: hypothetical protein ACK55I_07570, partial [bacterium]